MVNGEKISKVSLFGICNLLKQLLENDILSREECVAILQRIGDENGCFELDISFFKYHFFRKFKGKG